MNEENSQACLDHSVAAEKGVDVKTADTNATNNSISNVWGQLRRKGINQKDVDLIHRVANGRRDTYLIGRSKNSDVVVEDCESV